VALARALAKNAPLMLLDEPLVNLDYKLREELREELTQLFAQGDATVIYATTEPAEALLLGGHTAVLDAGELLQYGPTPEVFHYPASLRVARAFSDPPMNLLEGALAHGRVVLAGNISIPLPDVAHADGPVTVGVRAGALRLDAVPGRGRAGQVALAELSGSDTFVHVDTPPAIWWPSLPVCAISNWARSCRSISSQPRSTCSTRTATAYTPRRPGMSPASAARSPRSSSREPDMARIDLDLAHAYVANPQKDEDYALLPLTFHVRGRRRLRAAGPVGLRQDHAAQHHLGPAAPSQGTVLFDGGRDRRRRRRATSPRCSSSR
jgi:hypothetical protein